MILARIYQPDSLNLHANLLLDKKASHHVATVLRMRVGDMLYIFNGDSPGDYLASISQINKQGVVVTLTEFIARRNESPLKITLAQGIARGEKMDFIIQKAVELGVNTIYPLITERCNVKLDALRAAKRLEHWQSVIVSACEQSGRQQIPEIFPIMHFNEWLKKDKSEIRFILSPHADHPLAARTNRPSSVSFVVGPEGGLSEKETQSSIEQGFVPLTLGPRILRTETASIAALAVFQSLYGDI